MTDTSPRAPYRCAARTAAAAALLVVPSACGAAELVTHQASRTFDQRSDADDAKLAFRLPSLVPADARDITVRVQTDDPNKKAYSWSSAEGTLPSTCRPGDVPAGARTVVDFGGWPSEVARTSGQSCDDWHVTEVDDRFYAWLVLTAPTGAGTTSP